MTASQLLLIKPVQRAYKRHLCKVWDAVLSVSTHIKQH